MDHAVTRSPWLLALGGAVAVIFGIVALVLLGITLGALVILFGALALIGLHKEVRVLTWPGRDRSVATGKPAFPLVESRAASPGRLSLQSIKKREA
ncbi:MAG TPA: hypothetical protein VFR68_08535 [Candidatus Dormibacteraeota bacterium]|nr:hypothetical protein [Candidatus Dormibacteraeota bacterium]